VASRRVGTGHDERAAITGMAGGERARPSRRAAQPAWRAHGQHGGWRGERADVADMRVHVKCKLVKEN
jgi:hypothetical protein